MLQPFLNFSLQSFPLAEIAYPSRGCWLPWCYPPTSQSALPVLIRSRFHRLPHVRGVAWIPRKLWVPFSWQMPLPGRPRVRASLSLLPASFITFEAFFLLQDRSRHNEFPRSNGRCSPGL